MNHRELLNQAVAHHRAGRLQEAEQRYRQLLQQDPTHADAHHNLGVLNIGAGQMDAALAHFEAARRAQPGIAKYWLSTAEALIRRGQRTAVQTLFQQARAQGLDQTGLKTLEQRLLKAGLAPTGADALETQIQTAMGQHQRGEFKSAIQGYRHILSIDPNCDQALHLLGIAHQQTGQSAEAERLIRKAIALNGGVCEYHASHGRVLKSLKRFREALTAYEQALEIDPNNVAVLGDAGLVLKRLGRYQEALQAIDKALLRSSEDSGLQVNRGNLLMDLGEHSQALAAYQAALAIDPNSPIAQNSFGTALAELGRLDEASAAFAGAIRLQPDYVAAYKNLGNVLASQTRWKEAAEAYDQALQLQPNNVELRYQRDELLAQLEQPEQLEQRDVALQPDSNAGQDEFVFD